MAGGPPGSDQTEKVEETPKQDSAMEAEAKSLGRHLLETLNSASQSLLECSTKLEKNVVLLEECRADSSSIQSLLRPLRRGDRSQESFGHINRQLPPTTSRTKAAIRPQRHTVGKKPQTRRGKCYMQLTATADLSEAFCQLSTPMIKRGR